MWKAVIFNSTRFIIDPYFYDSRGRLRQKLSQNGRVIQAYQYSYGSGNNTITSITKYADATPSIAIKQYFDGFGKKTVLKRLTDNKILKTIEYDGMFRPVKITTLSGGESNIFYESSPLNRKKRTVDAVNNETIFTYGVNMIGQSGFTCLEVEDANGAKQTTCKSSIGNIVAKESGEGNITSWNYDAYNRVQQIITPEGRVYDYTYNKMDKLRTEKIPGQSTNYTYWYDDFGRKVIVQDPNGNIIINAYDNLDRLTGTYKVSDISSVQQQKIIDNQLVDNLYLQSEMLTKFTYEGDKTFVDMSKIKLLPFDDNLGFLQKDFKNDDLGRPITITNTFPNINIEEKVDMNYNDAGRVIKMQDSLSYKGSVSMAEFFTDYDFLQRPVKRYIKYDNGDKKAVKGYSYSENDRLEAEFTGYTTSGFLQAQDFTYDSTGRLLTINELKETSCQLPQSNCDFHFNKEFFTEFAYCIAGISIDGTAVLFTNNFEVTDLYIDPANQLKESINNALVNLGIEFNFIDVHYDQGTAPYGLFVVNTTILSISIDGLSAADVKLILCDGSMRIMDRTNCCQDLEYIDPEDFSNGMFSLNQDLYAQKLRYDGLNIDKITYANGCELGLLSMEFTYDLDHRLNSMMSSIAGLPVSKPYSASYTYNTDGDIMSLMRTGLISTSPSGNVYGMIDLLNYTYGQGRLTGIADNASGPGQAKGFPVTTTQFTYDNNGNTVVENGRKMTYAYNLLNLPSLMKKNGSYATDIIYTAAGKKYKTVENGKARYYIGIYEVYDDTLEKVKFTDGYIYIENADSLRYRYRLQDHLGNTVVFFEDLNGDGKIDNEPAGNFLPGTETEIIRRTLYYPFGLELDGLWDITASYDLGTEYTYNGKEQVKHLYDYGTRYYMPEIGRWLTVDPLAGKYPGWSPYNYVLGNPVRFIDPDGRMAVDALEDNPVFGSDGSYRGTTNEGYTGEVIIYDGDVDFSKMSASDLLATKGADTYDNQRGSLSGDAKSNIWTHIASQLEGQQIYDETFSMSSIEGSKIYHDASDGGSWNSRPKSMYSGWNDRITGTDKYTYSTTVENIQSSIVVHEWYSHIKKGQGNFPHLKSHRLAYKNVINFKSLWNNTTDDYKGFNMRTLLKYTESETGRTKVDPLYRNLYNKYKDKW